MKKKPLSCCLDLIKSALDKQDWKKTKRYGELAFKNLPRLSYSPLEEWLLYSRLNRAFFHLAEYSLSVDSSYKAYLIAAKNHFEPVYIADATFMMGHALLRMKSINEALPRFQKVEEYYQKYGEDTLSMDKQRRVSNFVGLGFCYLYKNELIKLKEIIYKKLAPYQIILQNKPVLIDYYHIKGEYLIAINEYGEARQTFQECIKVCEQVQIPRRALAAKIHLAYINILEGQLESAIPMLKNILKEAKQFKSSDVMFDVTCETGLLLSKCYTINKTPNKAAAIERRIKPILKKLDIIWLYEKTREFEQVYHRLQTMYHDTQFDNKPVPQVLSHMLKKHYETVPYKNVIIGQSNPMQEVYQLIEKISVTDLPVLIQGETGTGKELIARSIHYNSQRKGERWLATNCGSIPETLLGNELFGHTKGAFTDAKEDKKGYIELTSEGTLFLDEIADMSLAMQQKLLRVLEEKLVWRVGSSKPISVNTRFIFASNQNIEELVKAKKFREDLFYRINTIVIALPSLRERKEDIPLLVKHFLKRIDESGAKRSPDRNRERDITEDALKLLVNYNWIGNIRELENEIKRISTLYPHAKNITHEMLSETIRNYKAFLSSNPLKEARESAEKNIIIDALKKCNGNIAQTSRYLNYPRSHLYRKMNQLNILLNNDVTNK